jgi:hypothetical protein
VQGRGDLDLAGSSRAVPRRVVAYPILRSYRMRVCKGIDKEERMSGGGLVRLGGICGLLFAVLMVPAYVVGYPDAPTSTSGAREVLGYFGASPGTFVFFNGTVVLFSAVFFLWFLGVLYGVLRRAEGVDGALSSIVLAGGILFITLSCAGYAAVITHPATLERFVNYVPDAQRAFESLALSAWLYDFCQVGDAVMVSAASLVVLGSGILPRWLAWVGFLVAALTLLHFLIPLVGALSGLVWVALVSALMLGGLSQNASTPRRLSRRQ